MRKIKLLLLGLALMALTGCTVPSLNQFCAEEDVICDARITGEWIMDEGDYDGERTDAGTEAEAPAGGGTEEARRVIWRIERLEGAKAYTITIGDDDGKGQGELIGKLFKLGKWTCLDPYPKMDQAQNEFYFFHLIGAHILSGIDLEANRLRIKVLDLDWFKNQIVMGKVALKYAVCQDEQVLLTDDTENIKKFLQNYAEAEFPGGIEINLIRKPK